MVCENFPYGKSVHFERDKLTKRLEPDVPKEVIAQGLLETVLADFSLHPLFYFADQKVGELGGFPDWRKKGYEDGRFYLIQIIDALMQKGAQKDLDVYVEFEFYSREKPTLGNLYHRKQYLRPDDFAVDVKEPKFAGKAVVFRILYLGEIVDIYIAIRDKLMMDRLLEGSRARLLV